MSDELSSSATRLTGKQQNLVRASGHVPVRRRLLVLRSPLASAHTSAPVAAPLPPPRAPAGARPKEPRRHRHREGQGVRARNASQPSPITTARCGPELPARGCRVAPLTRPPGRSGVKMRVNAEGNSIPPPKNPKAPRAARLTNQKKSPPPRRPPRPRLPCLRSRIPKRSSRFQRALPSAPRVLPPHELRPPPMGPPLAAQDPSPSPSGGSGSGSSRRRLRRLDRRNASKNIGYDATNFCQFPPFRIGGSGDGGGDVQLLCQSLGLSGPDDFAIPLADWEAHKAVRSLASASTSPSSARHKPEPPARDSPLRHEGAEEPTRPADADHELPAKEPAARDAPIEALERPARLDPLESTRPDVKRAVGEGGIKGLRPPPVLKPPPSMALPAVCGAGSTWDILRSFAPDEKEHAPASRSGRSFAHQDAEDEDAAVVLTLEDLRLGESSEGFTGTSSLSTTNDDETSSTTTETMFYISPNGRFRKKIRSWNRGVLLGSGSFGTVYEGISDEGGFFAVKEVSLYDQGSNVKQCIFQLEQEIALLSQFEHENIVQYYGTDKEDSKLYIFLELVTQGSLASLYQKYRLRDTHVSAYTRQILNGLTYLHERNIVHRDIKCANILVHANGSVKLADFGLAKEITKFSAIKSCKGTVYWMAPEVVNPKKTYGPAADIWSLGCTVLEMLTQKIPYPDLEWTQALYRIGKGEAPAIPSGLSKDARDFISQCVKPNPEDRPSASKLLDHPFVNKSIRSISVTANHAELAEREGGLPGASIVNAQQHPRQPVMFPLVDSLTYV
ncbi:mitogen-activated protein kinase kinase kinase 1-like [Panicum miliaceum]|uniref:mitogen-activated protein kinase kinase kinase n=1 Tax=Panicum miliaceum TaxID=4540 RepID=A0A3L6TQ34_PANMI|nr:mitogen-activated protein kinase kinase kinase 1-like [Panicum miliaceum]